MTRRPERRVRYSSGAAEAARRPRVERRRRVPARARDSSEPLRPSCRGSGAAGRRSTRSLPLYRQRRSHARQGDARGESRLAHRGRHRPHRGHAGHEHARPAHARGGHGTGGRDPPQARPRDLHAPALCPAHGGHDRGHVHARRRAVEACPRSFLKRQIAACAGAGFIVRAAFEGEFSWPSEVPTAPSRPSTSRCASPPSG